MNKLVLAMASLSLLFGTAALTACGGGDDDDTGSSSSSSSSGGSSSSSGGSSSGGVTAVNGCTTYVDHTADANVAIDWKGPPLADTNKCSKIKAGSTVTFTGNFAMHPLSNKDGDTPSPITLFSTPDDSSSQAHVVTFPTAGTFGFVCLAHANMTGAFEVVP